LLLPPAAGVLEHKVQQGPRVTEVTLVPPARRALPAPQVPLAQTGKLALPVKLAPLVRPVQMVPQEQPGLPEQQEQTAAAVRWAS